MSLLLDALKRAEQEKLARPGDGAPAAPARPALELAPAPPAAEAARSPARVPPPIVPGLPGRSRRTPLLVGGGALALVAVAGAAYVWHAVSGLAPASRPAAVAQRLPAVAVAAPAPVERVVPAERAFPMETRLFTAAARVEAPAAPPAKAPEPVRPATTRIEPAPRAAAPAREPALLQRSDETRRARVPPETAAGYAALVAGDLAAARRSYASALAADATNVDATLGLATVEARGGRRDAASALYRRALELDPRNGTALAGLAALADGSPPETLEAQLAADIARHPGNAALHFTLGNLYASQARWTQAQAAYFEAHRLDPANADVLHNLAVSLDRLGQARVAADFYRRALASAKLQAAQLDGPAIERRLAEIDAAP